MQPNFLILGPPKTATTWLFHCLNEHPQIFVPSIKQVHFFDRNYNNGSVWYLKNFESAPEHSKAVGELTPDYFSLPKAAEKIKMSLGTTLKLIVIHRDPAERAYSEYKMKHIIGTVNGTFYDAVKQDPLIIQNSLYAKHLTQFSNVFGSNQVSVVDYTLLKNNPSKFFGVICNILDVDKFEPKMINQTVNKAHGEARNKNLIKQVISVRKQIERNRVGRLFMHKLRQSGMISLWHRIVFQNNQESVSQKIDLFSEIDSEFFQDDIDQLKNLQHLWVTD